MKYLLLIFLLTSCGPKKIHKFPEDPPTTSGSYLTWITIDKGKGVIVERWEVLEFTGFDRPREWNILHLHPDDWGITISYWTELPPRRD